MEYKNNIRNMSGELKAWQHGPRPVVFVSCLCEFVQKMQRVRPGTLL